MKMASGGVFAAIQSAARSWATPSATMVDRTCHRPMRAGERADTIRIAAMTGRGHARMSQAARIATAIHMIWKYLFMSNSTELATTTFGTMNRATTHATRNQRAARPRAVNAAMTASTNGMPRLVR